MNWDDFESFCQVVDHGGFSAAARALERPKSSLSASVARLEGQLGSRLLDRTTRHLRLTEAGDKLYREISRPLSQLREFAAEAASRSAEVQGTLRLAAPYEFGAHHVAPVACQVMLAHPRLAVHLDVEHARVPMFERPYDIVFTPSEHASSPSTVVTRSVYSLDRSLFASPALVAAHPAICAPEDLAGLPLLAGSDDTAWDFTAPDGSPAKVEIRNPRVRTGNAEVRREAAIAGLGVARITTTFCADAVARGLLVPVLPGWKCVPLKIFALLPGRELVPAKVRVFLDALEAHGQGVRPPAPPGDEPRAAGTGS